MKFRKGDVVRVTVNGPSLGDSRIVDGYEWDGMLRSGSILLDPRGVELVYRPNLSTREAERWVNAKPERWVEKFAGCNLETLWRAYLTDTGRRFFMGEGKSLRSAVNKLRRKLRAAGIETE